MAVIAASALPVELAVLLGALTVWAPALVNAPAATFVEAVKLLALWNEIPVPAVFKTAYTPIAEVWALMAAISELSVPPPAAFGKLTVAVPCPFWKVRVSAWAAQTAAPGAL